MKKRKVWRYTCEFCGKSNCSSGAMRAHELRCFKNPARLCPVCSSQWPLAAIEPHKLALADVNETTEPKIIAALLESVDGCPACALATINQSVLPQLDDHDCEGNFIGTHRYWVRWNYKQARADHYAEKHAEERCY